MLKNMVDTVPTIAVSNRNLCENDFIEQIEKILKLNIKALILREKDLEEKQYYYIAQKVIKLCKIYKKIFICHTYIDTAIKLNCNNIHLSLTDLKKAYINGKLVDFDIIGCSIHSLEEAIEAEMYGATYITAGHIFQTDCKKKLKPRGIYFLKEICEHVSIPVYAIGGISYDKLEIVMQTGANGVCVMSGFMKM